MLLRTASPPPPYRLLVIVINKQSKRVNRKLLNIIKKIESSKIVLFISRLWLASYLVDVAGATYGCTLSLIALIALPCLANKTRNEHKSHWRTVYYTRNRIKMCIAFSLSWWNWFVFSPIFVCVRYHITKWCHAPLKFIRFSISISLSLCILTFPFVPFIDPIWYDLFPWLNFRFNWFTISCLLISVDERFLPTLRFYCNAIMANRKIG